MASESRSNVYRILNIEKVVQRLKTLHRNTEDGRKPLHTGVEHANSQRWQIGAHCV